MLNTGHSGFGMQFSSLNCLQVLQNHLGLYPCPFYRDSISDLLHGMVLGSASSCARLKKKTDPDECAYNTAKSAESFLGNIRCDVQIGGSKFHY